MSKSQNKNRTPPLRYNGEHYHDPTAARAIQNSDDDTLYCKVCRSTEKVDVLKLGIYGPQTPEHKTAEICLCKKCQKYFVDLFHSRVKKIRKRGDKA